MNPDVSYQAMEKSEMVSAIGMIQLIDKHLTAFVNQPDVRKLGEIRTIGITTNVMPNGDVRIDIRGYIDQKVEIRNRWIDQKPQVPNV
jgi:hypothetical protein